MSTFCSIYRMAGKKEHIQTEEHFILIIVSLQTLEQRIWTSPRQNGF